MYSFMEQARESYGLLQDDLSKKVFKARLAFDLESTMSNAMNLLGLNPGFRCEEAKQIADWKEDLQSLQRDNIRFVIYGTGGRGKQAAYTLFNENIDFFGFCGRKGPEGYQNGMLMGKPVISPKQLIEHKADYYVAICADSFHEIMDTLKENNFPEEHILHCFDYSANQKQYFEFPKLYHPKTAFIDGGCLNCQDDYNFSAWCNDSYSYIIAFEPDPDNYKKRLDRLNNSPIRDLQIVEAGLSDVTGEVRFSSNSNGGSYIMQANKLPGSFSREKKQISIKTYALDELVDERKVGFIKLDIEGAEWEALHGAQKTIVRDKPLLALSVYHRNGDTLAFMTFLHKIVPEYRFWLRHYGPLHYETVLYASVDRLE